MAEACAAEGGRSEAQTLCLERSRTEREALLRAASRDSSLESSVLVEALRGLPSPGSCIEGSQPTDFPAFGSDQARYAEVDRARALVRLGRYDEARTMMTALLASAPTVVDAATLDALILQASADEHEGRSERAQSSLEAAYMQAKRLGDGWRAAQTATRLAWVTGYGLRQFDRSEDWLRHAEAALAQLPRPTALRRALRVQIAKLAIERGEFDDAVAGLEALLGSIPETQRGQAPEAHLYAALGGALLQAGRLHDAGEAIDRGLAIGERILGPDHPRFAVAHFNRATTAFRQGDNALATRHADRAITLSKSGRNGRIHAVSLEMRGRMSYMEGDRKQAERLFLESLRVAEEYDPEGQGAFAAHNALHNSLHDPGNGAEQWARAEHHGDRALAICEIVYHPRHPQCALARANLARTLGASGRLEEALTLYEHAIEIWRDSPGSSWSAIRGMIEATDVLIEMGQRSRAEQRLSQAQRWADEQTNPPSWMSTSVEERRERIMSLPRDEER